MTAVGPQRQRLVRRRSHRRGSSIVREQPKRLASRSPQTSEVALVRAEQIERPVALSEHDDRRVREPDAEVCVSLHDLPGAVDIFRGERVELVGAAYHLIEERRRPSIDVVSSKRVKRARDSAAGSRGRRSPSIAIPNLHGIGEDEPSKVPEVREVAESLLWTGRSRMPAVDPRSRDPPGSLRDRLAARQGRHGRGLQGARHPPRARGRDQGAARRVERRPAIQGTLGARGEEDLAASASQRLHALRRGLPGRSRLPGHGVPPRGDRGEPPEERVRCRSRRF